MDPIIFKEARTKNLLRHLFKMKPTSFKTWLKNMEPEILKNYPSYSKYSSLLTPKVFRFLLAEYGFDDPVEINKMIQEHYSKTGINGD